MPKLINQLYPKDEFYDEACLEECEIEITYEPMIKDNTGEIVAVLEVRTCECGEQWVSQMYTNGDLDAEIAARRMGFRDEYKEDYFDFGEEE